ncbi:MAG: hypothetical protein IJ848_03190 [Alphaproteobacteria bacterium]|nr:hypothetical protein [Alphaproteobacteria bacterium]
MKNVLNSCNECIDNLREYIEIYGEPDFDQQYITGTKHIVGMYYDNSSKETKEEYNKLLNKPIPNQKDKLLTLKHVILFYSTKLYEMMNRYYQEVLKIIVGSNILNRKDQTIKQEIISAVNRMSKKAIIDRMKTIIEKNNITSCESHQEYRETNRTNC